MRWVRGIVLVAILAASAWFHYTQQKEIYILEDDLAVLVQACHSNKKTLRELQEQTEVYLEQQKRVLKWQSLAEVDIMLIKTNSTRIAEHFKSSAYDPIIIGDAFDALKFYGDSL